MTAHRAEAALVAVIILMSGSVCSASLQPLHGAVRVHSEFSVGTQSVEELARRALAQHLDVLILTDLDLLRWDYSSPFLQSLLRFRLEGRSLKTRGTLDVYLAEIRRVQHLHPGLILLDGVEAAPFYYWQVDWRNRVWRIHRWDQHVLVLGLESPATYRGLPETGSGALWRWNWRSVLLLWPLALVFYAWISSAWHARWLRWVLAGGGVLLLIGNFPFKFPLWSAYGGDAGSVPYETCARYTRARNGVVLWAQPDSAHVQRAVSMLEGWARSLVVPSPSHVVVPPAGGIAAFGALGCGASTAVEPGGEWDQALRDYVRGKRIHPVWVEGESDPSCAGVDSALGMGRIQTVFLVRDHSRQGVLEALRAGRMYACRQRQGRALLLRRFEVTSGRTVARSGETVDADGSVEVHVEVSTGESVPQLVQIRLIRAGHIVRTVTAESPCEFHYVDAQLAPGIRTYYRLLASTAEAELVSNPIFVRRANP